MAELHDTMTDTDATDLTSHVADSGHTWALSALSGTGHMEIEGLRVLYNAPDNNQNTLVVSSYVPASADYSVFWDAVAQSELEQRIGFVLRLDEATVGWVFFEWDRNAGSPVWRVSEVVGGVTAGQNTAAAGTLGAGSSRTVEARLSGTSAGLYLDGVLTVSLTVSSAAAGKVGILASGGVSATGTGMHLDNVLTVPAEPPGPQAPPRGRVYVPAGLI